MEKTNLEQSQGSATKGLTSLMLSVMGMPLLAGMVLFVSSYLDVL